MNDNKNYTLSTDYKHLVELLRSGKSVVCFVTYNWSKNPEKVIMTTDICIARFNLINNDPNNEYSGFHVGCRGTVFIEAKNYEKEYNEDASLDEIFIEYCKEYELAYIEPTK